MGKFEADTQVAVLEAGGRDLERADFRGFRDRQVGIDDAVHGGLDFR